MPLFLKLMRGQLKTMVFFVTLFAVGMSLFLSVDTISIEFVDSLRKQSREFLGGDLEIRLRKPVSEEQKKILNNKLKNWNHSEEWRFFTMISGPQRPLLVQARAVDESFPLLGGFSDTTGGETYSGPRENEVYVPQSLMKILGYQVGDSVQVGIKNFIIRRELQGAPDSRFAFAQFTQRFYMNRSDVASAGLISKGSRIVRHHHYLSIEEIADKELLSFKNDLLSLIQDPEVAIESSADSNTELSRRFSMAIRLAKLFSLFTFLMAALGALQFFFNHLERERRNRVLFQTLGMHTSEVLRVYFKQGLFLTLISFIAAFALSSLGNMLATEFLEAKFGIIVSPVVRWEAYGLLAGASFFTYVLLMLGPVIQMRTESAHSIMQQSKVNFLRSLGLFAVQLAFGYLLAWLVTQSWILSFIFLAILVVGFAGMTLLAISIDFCLSFMRKQGFRWPAWESLRLLISFKLGPSLLVFSLLGLVTLVLYLMPGLNSMMKQQLLPEDKSQLPRWFLIDVQPEQLDELQHFVKQKGYREIEASPMIRARLLTVNGVDFVRKGDAKTLEEEQERRLRNRGYNLSYRSKLAESESIREGKFWDKSWSRGDGLPEISVEYRFKQRLGFNLGDTLEFEIEGFPQKGVISSVRDISWSSFKPNFFIQFQTGVLEIAPKTFIMSLPLIEGDDLAFQQEFFEKFPTVSLIDLKDLVSKTVSQLEKISVMLTSITFFALLCGLVLLLEIAYELAQSAKREMHLRFGLGQARGVILWLWLSPIFFWVLMAWGLGYLLHIAFVRIIGNQLFGDIPWVPEWTTFAWSIPVMIVFMLAVTWFFFRALVVEKTIDVLKAND